MPEPSQKDIEELEQSRRAAVRNYRVIKSDVARTPPPERREDKFTKIFRQLVSVRLTNQVQGVGGWALLYLKDPSSRSVSVRLTKLANQF